MSDCPCCALLTDGRLCPWCAEDAGRLTMDETIRRVAYAIEAKTITFLGPSFKAACRQIDARGGPSIMTMRQAKAAVETVMSTMGYADHAASSQT